MGIFSFLFGKKEEEKKEIEKVKLEDLEKLIKDKREKIKESEKRIIQEIYPLITSLTEGLKEGIKGIEKIDLSKRREEERIKRIVYENLGYYSENVTNLIEELEKINKESIEELEKDIKKTLEEFSKKSKSSFEKSTIIVGEEIANIEEKVKIFFKEFNRILESNKEIIQNLKILNQTEQNLKNIEQNKEEIEELSMEIEETEKKISLMK